jgi:ligand-binding sensor domain-containing protein
MYKKIIVLFLPLYLCSGSFFYGQITEWEIFDESNSLLPNNTVRCLIVDRTNELWIGTDHGLAHLSNGSWEIFNTTNSGLTDDYIRALAVDYNNDIWVGTTLGGVFKYDGSNWQEFSTFNSNIPDNFIRAISIDTAGNKWIGTVEGLTMFNDTNWQTWTIANSGILSNNITSIGIDSQNNKYIGTINGGLIYIINGILSNYTILNAGVPDNSVATVQIDELGKPWYASPAQGLFTDTGNQTWLLQNSSNSGLASNSLTSILVPTKMVYRLKHIIHFGKTILFPIQEFLRTTFYLLQKIRTIIFGLVPIQKVL